MRRRPAVGVVLCNRILPLFRIGVSLIMACLSSNRAPTNAAMHTHTLTFPVTTAYITYTCSTVQPVHTHLAPTYMALFPFSSTFTLSIRLSIYRPAALSFITLSLHIPPPSRFIICNLPQCAFLVCRLLPWLDFASVIISVFCITAGRTFFF